MVYVPVREEPSYMIKVFVDIIWVWVLFLEHGAGRKSQDLPSMPGVLALPQLALWLWSTHVLASASICTKTDDCLLSEGNWKPEESFFSVCLQQKAVQRAVPVQSSASARFFVGGVGIPSLILSFLTWTVGSTTLLEFSRHLKPLDTDCWARQVKTSSHSHRHGSEFRKVSS